jgi:FMN phosphatase YigB (HAD superfamily)
MSCLVLLAALTLCSWSYAEETRYRVLLGRVPGADEIEAGNIRAGIRILEDQLKNGDPAKQGEVWSTLCAAFIINRSLVEAERACNKAVAIDPDDYALNNRGVLRVYKGDLAGARADFERVRPSDVEAYLEQLKAKNVRLVAATNFDLVGELLAMRRLEEGKSWREVSTADVESLDH